MWQQWDSNPRPFGLVPKTSALDRSAMLPSYPRLRLFIIDPLDNVTTTLQQAMYG